MFYHCHLSTLTPAPIPSGKTSLKKTMFGEPYDTQERPSSGIWADPSTTRITFRQYREWVQQPATKDDSHRLNLEYIDSIIDYVLKFLRQPRVSAHVECIREHTL